MSKGVKIMLGKPTEVNCFSKQLVISSKTSKILPKEGSWKSVATKQCEASWWLTPITLYWAG